MTAEAFARRLHDQTMTACALALAPVLEERPALLRAVLRGDARVLWTVGGWHAPDEVAHALAPCDGGAVAVVVQDAIVRAEPRRISVSLSPRGANDAAPSTSAAVYTTAKRGPHLPGKSRHWMLRHVASIPGARKIGRDWQITPADYERWLTEQDAKRCAAASSKRQPASTAHEIAMRGLAKLGMRPTKGCTDA